MKTPHNSIKFLPLCVSILPLLGGFAAGGGLKSERWNGVPGKTIDSMKVAMCGGSANVITTTTSGESGQNVGDNYGLRLRGTLCAPEDGEYTFFVAGDESVEFWFSQDASPFHKELIASRPSAGTFRGWTGFASQRSRVFRLHQGQICYVEGLLKEGTGQDSLSLGWHHLNPSYTETSWPSTNGTWTQNGDTLTCSVASDDIWGTSDSGVFRYRTWSGDGEFVTRVTSLNNVHSWEKAGLMIRTGTAADARNVFLARTGGNGMTFQRRLTDGAATTSISYPIVQEWVRFTRVGDKISAATSDDGENWVGQSSATFTNLPTSILVGTAVCSRTGSGGSPALATFGTIDARPDTATEVIPGGALTPYVLDSSDLNDNGIPDDFDQAIQGDNLAKSQFGDPDGDLVSNLQEYQRNTNPMEADRAAGCLRVEMWNYILGLAVGDLVESEEFHHAADSVSLKPPGSLKFSGSNFGTRCRGYITPTVTGDYTFWISGQASAELWISADPVLGKQAKRRVAMLDPELGNGYGIAWPDTNLWDCYAMQQSGKIHMEANQSYYIETLQKNGTDGGAHVSLAWAVDDNPRENLPASVVSAYLPDINDESAPANPDGTVAAGTTPVIVGDPLSINLGAFTAASTDWSLTANGLVSAGFRGEATWNFSVDTDGYRLVRLNMELMGTSYGYEEVPVVVKVDGKEVCRRCVRFSALKLGMLDAVTPWLAAGTHQVSVLVDNMLARRTVCIVSLDICELSNALDVLKQDNRVISLHGSSRTSPACIEGFARAPGVVQVTGSAEQVTPIVVMKGTGNGHWFADVELANQNGGQAYSVDFEQGCETTGSREWLATNVMTTPSLTIRKGDSLRIGAWGADLGATSTVTSSLGGPWTLTGQETFTLEFPNAGAFSLTGAMPGANAELIVNVVAAPNIPSTTIDALDIGSRVLSCTAGEGIVFDSQADLCRVETKRTNTTSATVTLWPLQPVECGVAARVFADGPILAVTQVNVIGVSNALQNDLTSLAAGGIEGYKIVASPLTVTNLPTGGHVDVSIFRAGVMFVDGSAFKIIRPSDLVNNVVNLEFLCPVNMTGGYCHTLRVYDRNGVLLGEH